MLPITTIILENVLTTLSIILLSTVKFALVPPLAFLKYHMSFGQVCFYHTLGGLLGVLFFYFLSAEVLIVWNWFKSLKSVHLVRSNVLRSSTQMSTRRKIVRIKTRWGLLGIVLLTPIILSIPLGAFLLARFYPGWRSVLVLCGAIIVWSLLINGVFVAFA